jgi:hypothetical protein
MALIIAADNLNILNPVVAAALQNPEAGAGLSHALADVLQPELREAARFINQVS